MKQTFKEWMSKVDKIVEAKIGLSVDDLPDFMFHDAYDDGVSPTKAATQSIRDADDLY